LRLVVLYLGRFVDDNNNAYLVTSCIDNKLPFLLRFLNNLLSRCSDCVWYGQVYCDGDIVVVGEKTLRRTYCTYMYCTTYTVCCTFDMREVKLMGQKACMSTCTEILQSVPVYSNGSDARK
jgi:hypothetical protein